MKNKLLLTILIGTVLPFCNNFKTNSNQSYSNKIRKQMVLPEPNPGSNDGCRLVSENICAHTVRDVEEVKGLIKNTEYRGKNYKSGVMDNYYNFILTGIKKIEGVYSHYRLLSKTLLMSGASSLEIDEKINNYYRENETFYFNQKLSVNLEASLYFNVGIDTDILDVGGGMSISTDTGLERQYEYSYSSKVEKSEEIYIRSMLNKEIAEEYCPDNYAMTLGDVGTFYEITFKYRNVVKTWFGNKKDSYKESKLLLVNESELVRTFVYDDLLTSGFDKYFAI